MTAHSVLPGPFDWFDERAAKLGGISNVTQHSPLTACNKGNVSNSR